ncbi:capsular polysaccharide biosynthesis protein [Psychrobacter alimentarius]|uniref:capsular polysaccharide biosynthesis protein n=1 Tax=Psychrobacter alimentarius TaxID=261164 RepID=UPI00191A2925|nr:capsular polysaccharide biosynthesis protein [Psychrobacter alimentarius]
MAKSDADEIKVTAISTSDNAALLSSPKHSVPKRLAVIGKGMSRNNQLLSQVLQADIQRWYPWSSLQQKISHAPTKNPNAFIGWGHKKSYQRANKTAVKHNLATLSIEDGFLRSLDSGVGSRHGLSVVVDDVGIYFDLTKTSHLEQLIITRTTSDANSEQRAQDDHHAQQLMSRICNERLSKYNAVMDCPSLDEWVDEQHPTTLKNTSKPHVLLIDQVAGDASVQGAGANKGQFRRMLKAACRNHPNAHIWIKAHPAAKTGYLTNLKLPKNVRILSQALNPMALLTQVDHVYTVSSHMGFEALMLGKTVHCFGVNWYSGWGLTDDKGAPKRLLKTVQQRRQNIAKTLLDKKTLSNSAVFSLLPTNKVHTTLETLFYSAYIDYSRYVDPATRQACDIETAIEWLVTNRHWQSCLDSHLTIFEFSRWKIPFVKAFVDLPRTTLFIKPKPRLKNLLHPDHLRVNYEQTLLVWGLAKRQKLQEKLRSKRISPPTIYCMEDGFIRSNGLGATLLAPLSVVIDKQGIYYDATQPSDLESLLRQCKPLSLEQKTRVQALQSKLLTQRVSKYNVGASTNNLPNSWMQEAKLSGKRRILIIGQVEDDLSVQYCGSAIKTNSGLIERICKDNPDAYLIYKPHPDVEAGLRAGQVTDACLRQVQAVAYDTAMPDCLECVDEIHTISSLTGFEALLRGLDVVCYGLPFYAGWGLTTDIDAHLSPKDKYLKRRTRDTVLTLEQLLHCALICYPLYRLPNGYGLSQVEQVIDYLYPLVDTSNESLQAEKTHNKIRSASSPISTLSASIHPTQIKRLAATRFMQQRHRWQQRLRKISR